MIRKQCALEQLLMEGILHMTISLANSFGINQLLCNKRKF